MFDFISKSFQEKVGFIYCNHFNFFLFIKSILIKYLLKKNEGISSIYLNLVLKKSQSEVFISDLDNNENLYKLKKNKKINVLLIQNGGRGGVYDIFETLKKNQDFEVDDFIVFGENIKNKYKEYVKANYHILGSYRLNFFNQNFNINKQDIKNINSITYISQFRKNDKNNLEEIKVIKFLDTYCFKNEYKLKVHCVARHKGILIDLSGKGFKSESDYFKKNIKKANTEFVFSNSTLDSYNNLKKANLVISIDSTMSLEMFALYKKIVFFSIRGSKFNSSKFGWPGKYPDDGLFWCNSYDESKFTKILDNVQKINQNSWIDQLKKFKKDIIYQDNEFSRKIILLIKKYIIN